MCSEIHTKDELTRLLRFVLILTKMSDNTCIDKPDSIVERHEFKVYKSILLTKKRQTCLMFLVRHVGV